MQEKVFLLSPLQVANQIGKATASETTSAIINQQQDCLYMKSVLVSTGQNKNDDIFLPDEMWKARFSPDTKPVNWEHNTGYEIIDSPDGGGRRVVADNQIIGVMQHSYVAHKDGEPINVEASETEDFEIPRDFDIITEAVIWKYLFPKTASKLVNEASANRIFVSMEAWFNKFDYRVGNNIVARNDETAFLDRHLRSKGGDGIFEGEKVGRVLRNIVFGGVGIVANPANEDSIIQSFTNADYKETNIANSAIASNTIGHISLDSNFEEYQEVCNNMANEKELDTSASAQVNITSDDYKQVVQRLVKAEHVIDTKNAELVEAKAEIEALKASSDNVKSAFARGAESLASTLGDGAALKISKAGAENFFDILVDVVTDSLAGQDSVKSELEEAKSKLAQLEDEKKLITRAQRIRDELSLSADDKGRAEKLVASTEKLDDEAFASWLENTKELFAQAQFPFAKKDDKKKEEEDKKKEKDSKAGVDSDGITDPAVLDNVRATASAPAGVDNAVQAVPLPERMVTLASALFSANKRNNKEGGQ